MPSDELGRCRTVPQRRPGVAHRDRDQTRLTTWAAPARAGSCRGRWVAALRVRRAGRRSACTAPPVAEEDVDVARVDADVCPRSVVVVAVGGTVAPDPGVGHQAGRWSSHGIEVRLNHARMSCRSCGCGRGEFERSPRPPAFPVAAPSSRFPGVPIYRIRPARRWQSALQGHWNSNGPMSIFPPWTRGAPSTSVVRLVGKMPASMIAGTVGGGGGATTRPTLSR